MRDLDLALCAGECVGLVGHNGAGKSTAIKLMLGLIRPSAGDIAVLGETPTAGRGARRRDEVGYLPEAIALYPSLTGAETLAFYARLKRRPVAANAALLERVGLAAAAHRRVGGYSKGMRQRLGLAQALLGEPRLLLLDEPTTGLDPAVRQNFYEILRDLRRDGATILLSSHALAELEGEVDRVVVLNQGRKIVDGSIAELRALAAIRPRVRLRLSRLPSRRSASPPPGPNGRRPTTGGSKRHATRTTSPPCCATCRRLPRRSKSSARRSTSSTRSFRRERHEPDRHHRRSRNCATAFATAGSSRPRFCSPPWR